jgi:hypothetical protein
MERISPLRLGWLKAYLAEGEPTFLDATASAIAAGYRGKSRAVYRQIGYLNRIQLQRKIAEWLDEAGMSEVQLKTRLLLLMEAKETKFERLKGAVLQSSLPEGYKVVASSGTIITTKDGEVYGNGDTLLAIDVQALETQRRTLDMVLKMKGLYAPEKHEHSGGVATLVQFSEQDRKLARQVIEASIKKLMEEKGEESA